MISEVLEKHLTPVTGTLSPTSLYLWIFSAARTSLAETIKQSHAVMERLRFSCLFDYVQAAECWSPLSRKVKAQHVTFYVQWLLPCLLAQQTQCKASPTQVHPWYPRFRKSRCVNGATGWMFRLWKLEVCTYAAFCHNLVIGNWKIARRERAPTGWASQTIFPVSCGISSANCSVSIVVRRLRPKERSTVGRSPLEKTSRTNVLD